jgi:sirohydrochlorin ferrochelatase
MSQAIAIIGHGSLYPGSGAAMIRLAARLRQDGAAPIVAAGFLNFSRPTFDQAIARCVARGASAITVLPYFLVEGYFVRVTLQGMIDAAQAQHPQVAFVRAPALGAHPALAELVVRRALAADPDSSGPRGLVLLAHGSPRPPADDPIQAIAGQIRDRGDFAHVGLGYLDLQEPAIPAAISACVGVGLERVIAVPYFIQLATICRPRSPPAAPSTPAPACCWPSTSATTRCWRRCWPTGRGRPPRHRLYYGTSS